MRSPLFLCLCVSLLGIRATSAQITKSVLFIGNSYTATNNLPLMVKNMANSTGDKLITDASTQGGYRFLNHSGNTGTLNKIKSSKWDYVVLQAQSQETSWEQSQMEIELYPHAKSLCESIRSNYACSTPMFYMTWGRKNGDATNCKYVPWVCTYEGMDSAIAATYVKMAVDNETKVSPVGAVWRYLREKHPSIELYSSDGSHPSEAGTYAAACAFYTMIFGKDPTKITWGGSLSALDMYYIQNAASKVVFEDLDTWDFTTGSGVWAQFSEEISGDSVKFFSAGSEFDSLLWDFGDGAISKDENPIHVYKKSGNYDVVLRAYKCGDVHDSSHSIKVEIVTVGFDNTAIEFISIYPNPSHGYFRVSGVYEPISFQIFHSSGALVQIGQIKGDERVAVEGLAEGVYVVQLSTGDILRLIKQ